MYWYRGSIRPSRKSNLLYCHRRISVFYKHRTGAAQGNPRGAAFFGDWERCRSRPAHGAPERGAVPVRRTGVRCPRAAVGRGGVSAHPSSEMGRGCSMQYTASLMRRNTAARRLSSGFSALLKHHQNILRLFRRKKAAEPRMDDLFAIAVSPRLCRSRLTAGAAVAVFRPIAGAVFHRADQQFPQGLCRLLTHYPDW